ncbi:LysR family transcriptional regulator [Chachezhania antarctica]|uniref:LysR family transcriptional regulator n=1 Tax=Chachezhania antarctica TaxID=2340860 RepID=UPI000EAD9D81|nr:LysR family transcriptional regulator [Chachezhania antarctica]|tara:strand:+ start:12251 stop:13165 length:915 start_codon:yes stop_codon:yes gene_type:complete
MLSLRQLEVFREVVRRGSISAAAHSLSIAQPSVSNTVRRLEDVLGVKLFIRTASGLRPTVIGQQVFDASNPTLAALEHLSETVMEVVKGGHVTFRLGATQSVANALGPRVLARFAAKRPTTRLRLDTISLKQVRDYLLVGEGDCAMTIVPMEDAAFISRRLSSVAMTCVVPIDHPLARNNDITTSDLAGEPLVYLHPRSPHLGNLTAMFAAARVQPQIAIETRFANTAPQLIREGFGIAPIDELTARGIHDPGLKVLPIRGSPRQPLLFQCRADKIGEADIDLFYQCMCAALEDFGLPDESEAL